MGFSQSGHGEQQHAFLRGIGPVRGGLVFHLALLARDGGWGNEKAPPIERRGLGLSNVV
jgi:hypothetical protein